MSSFHVKAFLKYQVILSCPLILMREALQFWLEAVEGERNLLTSGLYQRVIDWHSQFHEEIKYQTLEKTWENQFPQETSLKYLAYVVLPWLPVFWGLMRKRAENLTFQKTGLSLISIFRMTPLLPPAAVPGPPKSRTFYIQHLWA